MKLFSDRLVRNVYNNDPQLMPEVWTMICEHTGRSGWDYHQVVAMNKAAEKSDLTVIQFVLNNFTRGVAQ